MASPYRFDADPYKDIGPSRSRTGLSAVTAGATSGGEGYQRSALLPGSRGFAAANFGAAPRTDYVAPVTPVVEPTPTATQTATPTVQPSLAPIEDQPANGRDAEGAGAETGIADGGPPGDLSDLGFGVNGATLGSILGGIAGGLLAGPPGALAGSLAGKAVGSSLSSTPAPEPVAQPTAQPTAPGTPGGGDGGDFGSGSGAGSFGGGLGDMGAAEMGLGAGGLGAMSGSDIMGFSRGGRVTPNRLMKGMPMHGQKGGLGAVTAGKKPFMGGYADGGSVGGYGEAAMYTADPRIQSLLARAPWLMEEMKRISLDKAPVNPANPSTGNMGGYAEGGPVMSPDDVNAALWRRAQGQTAPTPEMVQAARVANAPTEMRRGGMRFAENNAQTDAYYGARFGSDPQFRPEARYLGDPTYLTGDGQGMDDPLTWYHAMQRQRDAVNGNTQMIEGAPIGPDHPLFTPRSNRQPQFKGAHSMGEKVPNYAEGGPVDALAGPNPPGPDDGFAALDQGEFVVKQDQAQRPDYAPILDQINQGTYQPGGDEGMGDLDLDMGAQGNYPPSTAESATPDDMMQRLAMMPPEQSQALSQAVSDPMVLGALFALLGPSFMGVMSTLQQQGQQPPGMSGGMGGGMQPPGMLAISPDRAGMRPPGGGLGGINA